MTDQYFGYDTNANPEMQGKREAQAWEAANVLYYPDGDTSMNGDYQPTPQGGSDSIEKIWKRMKTQVADEVDALQEQWFQVSMVIENLRDSIFNEATSLSQTWKGKASEAFLARGPGAAMKSLDDWYNAALANSLGLIYLAGTIRDYQAKIDVLYQNYVKAMVRFSDQWTEDHSWRYVGRGGRVKVDGDPKQLHSDQYVNDLRDAAEPWNKQARDLAYQMGQGYWQVVNQHLLQGTSTVFEGPTDAVVPDPRFLYHVDVPNVNVPNVPNVPNVNVPNVPNMPNVPNVPNAPGTPDTPTAPNLPDVTVPESTAPSVHPSVGGTPVPDVNVPNVDPTLVAGLATNQALLGQLAEGVPNLGGAPGGLGGLGGLGRGLGMPPMGPKLKKGTLGRGTGAPESEEGAGGRSMPPNTLRNKSGRPGEERPLVPGEEEEEFGRPSGLNSSPPVLRGRSAAGGRRPPVTEEGEGINRSGTPLRPGSAPPVLNRKRQGGDQTQRMSGPAGPVDDDVLRPGQPGTSAPVLRGTRLSQSGPPEEVDPPARAVRGALRQPAGVTEPEMASRRKTMDAKRDEERARVEREYEKIRRLLDNEEPWTVATPGGAVLDNAPERPVHGVEPRPTLRGGATG